MLKGLGDLGNIMKLQKEFKNMQKKLQNMQIEGESPDGKVKAVVTGEYKLISLTIDEEYYKESDKAKMEKAVISAVNNAVGKIKERAAKEMSSLTGGMNIPGLGNFLQ